MRAIRSAVLLGALATGTLTLTGCDALVWGPEGARVIDTTERLIDAVADGSVSNLVCEDANLDLGTPNDWSGRAAGEPERFAGDFWEEQIPLDPQWSINLEGLPNGAEPGNQFPGDVFYRDGADGLCVIDVTWVTLEGVG